MSDSKVVIALDYPSAQTARQFVNSLNPEACKLKVGKELFTIAGPDFVRELVEQDFDVFLDLKFHDIPNTVAKAVYSAAELGVWMVNVHAAGGSRMMKAAMDSLEQWQADNPGKRSPLLIAVTVLTSMSEDELRETGVDKPLDEQVLHLADLAETCGLNGVVCSAEEAEVLRRKHQASFLLVTPGIRPEGSATDDQTRVMTPVDAVSAGVNYLVMGRPIRNHSNPQQLLSDINQQISALTG